eukprot:5033639-Pyramimonas_sp.AAC.1
MVAPLELIPEEEFTKVMDVNVTGPLRVTQQFLPLLKLSENERRIVNVGSQALAILVSTACARNTHERSLLLQLVCPEERALVRRSGYIRRRVYALFPRAIGSGA